MSGEDLGAATARHRSRSASMVVVMVLSLLAGGLFTATGAAAQAAPEHATRVELQVRRDGIVRVRDGVAKLHMRIRCSAPTTGEIDGVLEQPNHLRAARILDVPCDRGWFAFDLAFWLDHHRFTPGLARLNVTAMAGFGESFGQTSVRMPAMLFADPRSAQG